MDETYEKLIAGLVRHDTREYLLQLLASANLQSPGRSEEQAPDVRVRTNMDFWKLFVHDYGTPKPILKWISIEDVQLTDWFPRTPGIFHTHRAQRARHAAKQRSRIENGILHYDPVGKGDMVHKGGVGCLRFKPIRIEGVDCWLYTATSDDYCHTGIPLAIPHKLLENIGFDTTYRVNLKGQVRFLPDFLESYFYDWVDIPQVYVLVDAIQKSQKKAQPIKITPTVLFSFDPSKELEGIDDDEFRSRRRWDYTQCGVSYVTCYSKDTEEAAGWIEKYVYKYGGSILTNFDQQSPVWAGVPFSIQRFMTGELDLTASRDIRLYVDRAVVEQVNSLHTRTVDMSKKIEIHVNDSGKLDITGDLIIADEIRDSFNKTNSISDDDLKKLVQDITVAVGKMSQELPQNVQKEVAQDLDILTTEATKQQPAKRRWEFSVEGLKKAAQNVGEIGKPVIELAAKIAAILALRSV
jgi:hypothetical protein